MRHRTYRKLLANIRFLALDRARLKRECDLLWTELGRTRKQVIGMEEANRRLAARLRGQSE
jgi:hypothetical protein